MWTLLDADANCLAAMAELQSQQVLPHERIETARCRAPLWEIISDGILIKSFVDFETFTRL